MTSKSDICRTCMIQIDSDQGTNINEKIIYEYDQSENWLTDIKTMFTCVTSIETSPDEIPNLICFKCFQKLEYSFTFKLQCLKVNLELRKQSESLKKVSAPVDNDVNHDAITAKSLIENFLNVNSIHENSSQSKNQSIGHDYDSSTQERDSDLENSNIIRNKNTSNSNLDPTDPTDQIDVDINFEEPIYSELTNEKYSTEESTLQSITQHDINCDKPHTTQTEEKKFVCNICGARLLRKGTLQKHLQRHSNIKKFKCQECHMEFHFKDDLTKHSICHKIKSNFTCEICGSIFSRKDALLTHTKIHLGIKPNVCPHCPKKFLNSYNLQNHIRVHSKECPYICSYCDKAFSQRTSLVQHIKIHTGLNMHACNGCGHKFKQAYLLRNHYKKRIECLKLSENKI